MSILRELEALTGDRQHVFTGRDPKKPMSDAAINAALRRMGYDTKTEITGHGFRAMARTILAEELHQKPEVIEHQLAHKVPDALGSAYNRTKFLKERRAMMQLWADYLDGSEGRCVNDDGDCRLDGLRRVPKVGKIFPWALRMGILRRNPEYQKDGDKYLGICRDVLPKYGPCVALSQSDYDKLEYHPDHRHFEPERLGQESEDAWLSRVKKGTVTSLPVVVAGKASGARPWDEGD